MAIVRYKVDVVQYTKNERIFSNCNAITFINTGPVTVLVNNIPLVTNANLVIAGNAGEMDITEYRIDFNLATTGILTVLRKFNLD